MIQASAGGNWVAEHDLPNIIAGEDDASFQLGLCRKDPELISQLGLSEELSGISVRTIDRV